jgi:enoyl-CoA hydratase
MTEEHSAILLEKGAAIATITLNRPHARNAFRHHDYDLLLEHIESCESDPDIRVVIVAAAGSVFSVGDDIEGYVGGPREEWTHDHPFYGAVYRGDVLGAKLSGYRIPLQVLSQKCMTSGKIYIGAVNGLCWAPEMLYAFDFVVAAEVAQFAQGDLKIGICPGGGATQTLPRLLGRRRAIEFILRPRQISAEEAYRIGLVNEVVPLAELEARTWALAEELAVLPECAVKTTKLAITRAQEMTLEQGLEMEQDYMVLSSQAGHPWDFARKFWANKAARKA